MSSDTTVSGDFQLSRWAGEKLRLLRDQAVIDLDGYPLAMSMVGLTIDEVLLYPWPKDISLSAKGRLHARSGSFVLTITRHNSDGRGLDPSDQIVMDISLGKREVFASVPFIPGQPYGPSGFEQLLEAALDSLITAAKRHAEMHRMTWPRNPR